MTPHERNPILYAPADGADYVTCRTCAKCELFDISCSCPCCGERMRGDVGICDESGGQVDIDEPRTGGDAECWESR